MILDRFRVTGQAAVVTGAGRGIGAATAVALAQAGADVLISARTEDQLAKVAREIEAPGRRAVVVPADLSDLDAAASLAGAAVEAFGRLDIVVNNVGGALPRPFLATKPHHLADAFQFNVGIAHRLTQAAVPYLLASRDRQNGGRAGMVRRAGARAGGRARDQYLLGDGPGRGPRLPRLRHGQGGPGPLHPARRGRPGPADPGQRHRRRLGGDLGAGHRAHRRRTARPDGAGHPARPDRRSRGHRRRGAFPGLACRGYITGKIIEVDGGLSQPNLESRRCRTCDPGGPGTGGRRLRAIRCRRGSGGGAWGC